jgi:hypothetical protein
MYQVVVGNAAIGMTTASDSNILEYKVVNAAKVSLNNFYHMDHRGRAITDNILSTSKSRL